MRVVLVAPSLPENVGMVARAMGCFGIAELVLVGGVAPSHPQAAAAAAGAEDVLAAARQVRTLAEALSGVEVAIATTARPYDRPDLRTVPVREAAKLAGPDAAWVFGTEKHGLTIVSAQACHQIARIPSVGQSLNLAQAVAICLYESFLAQAETGQSPASGRAAPLVGDAATAGRALAGWLVRSGAARDRNAGSKAHTLLRIASRLDLDADETELLRSIFNRLTIIKK